MNKDKLKKYILVRPNGEFEIVYGKSSLDIVKKYDLATRENCKTRITECEI